MHTNDTGHDSDNVESNIVDANDCGWTGGSGGEESDNEDSDEENDDEIDIDVHMLHTLQ